MVRGITLFAARDMLAKSRNTRLDNLYRGGVCIPSRAE
jgi:hypothetical protein